MPATHAATHFSPLSAYRPLSTDQLVLGIDGGGSRTVAILAPVAGSGDRIENEIMGRGIAGPANYQAAGRERALESLDGAVQQAFNSVGIPRGPLAAACLGLAGADRPADREMLGEWAGRVQLAARVRFENDGMLVLAAGTPACSGVAVIAGTGSIAVARSPDGRTARAGGWGYLFGDEGSGYAMALAGLRAVARAADGRGPATALTSAFLSQLGIERAEQLVPAVYAAGLDRGAIARLAEIVTAAAAADDAQAAAILQRASEELAEIASAAARNAGFDVDQPVPLALAGGVLTGCAALRELLVGEVRRRRILAAPVCVVSEPALGAVRLAREMLV